MEYQNDYVKDFAYRTKKNLEFIKKEVEIQKNNGVPLKDISVYEVTQLMNSFIGLVVFPRQKYFNDLPINVRFISKEANQIFNDIKINPHKYQYTSTYLKFNNRNREYIDNEIEELTVKSLIRHLRNAVCHEKLEVYPIGGKKTKEIEHFCFNDQHKNYPEMKFRIVLSVKDIEILALAICDVLTKCSKKNHNNH